MVESSGSDAASEGRIAALENKVGDIEALLNGITQELQDLKSTKMMMSQLRDERTSQQLKRVQLVVQGGQVPDAVAGELTPQAQSGSTIILHKGDHRTADAGPQALEEPSMDMIMQTDGTKKLEPRRGDYIVAATGDRRTKKSVSAKAE